MPPHTFTKTVIAISRRVTRKDHPWCPRLERLNCVKCIKKWNEKCAKERRRSEKIAQSQMSPTVLHRVSKVFHRDNTFDDASTDDQDCDNGTHSYSDSESSMATTDNNIGAGRTVDKYFLQPSGLRLENYVNRVWGPYLVPLHKIGRTLTQAFARIYAQKSFVVAFNFAYIKTHLHKDEYQAFRRLIHDAG